MENLTKVSFAASVRIYIQHKQAIEKHSPWYKKDVIAQSMSKCSSLLVMVKRDCSNYTLPQLAKMVVVYQNHLMMILPAPNNPSYQRQKEKLEKLIQTSIELAK
jgi:hypothetical protein